jgi:hypothetical protein
MRKKNQTEQLFSHHVSPRLEEVKMYFSTKGAPEAEAEAFFYVYENRQWRTQKGTFYKSWRVIAYQWIVSVLGRKRFCHSREARPGIGPFGLN